MDRLKGFLARVGGMLVSPRSTLTDLCRGATGGLSDLMWLLLLQVVAVQLPALVRAAWTMVAVSYSAGISSLLNIVAASMVVQLVGVLGAAVIMGWFTRGIQTSSRNIDLAALSMIPAVCLQLLMSLVMGIVRYRPGQAAALAVLVAGALWFVALAVTAVKIMIAEDQGGSRE